MRTTTAGERTRLAGNWNGYCRLHILDTDGAYKTMHALSGINWIKRTEVNADNDQPMASGTLHLIRAHGALSLAPLREDSVLNRDAGASYAPLLLAGRGTTALPGFKLEKAITAVGVAPVAGDWKEVLRGKIDHVDDSGPVIRLDVRDCAAYLSDAKIEDPTVYSGPAPTLQPLQTVMQAILDDWAPVAVTLSTPVDPLWDISEYEQPAGNLFEALRTLATQRGWDVRYKYDAANVSRLTLRDPRAPRSVDATFGPGEYLAVPRHASGDADVRNAVRIYWTP